MEIEQITVGDLRRMKDQEGLILQGCGGPLWEWVDGVNQMLTENGCLLEGTTFQKVSSFEHDGCTCLLFPFTGDVKLDMGRLVAWRIQSHDVFGGTWLSDYVSNRLGGFARNQPEPKKEQTKDYDILDFQRGHSMAQRRVAGAQFHELLIGNYDLLERERSQPEQISLDEMMGKPIDVEQMLKERIIPCKTEQCKQITITFERNQVHENVYESHCPLPLSSAAPEQHSRCLCG